MHKVVVTIVLTYQLNLYFSHICLLLLISNFLVRIARIWICEYWDIMVYNTVELLLLRMVNF